MDLVFEMNVLNNEVYVKTWIILGTALIGIGNCQPQGITYYIVKLLSDKLKGKSFPFKKAGII